jgi:hypothetical protein
VVFLRVRHECRRHEMAVVGDRPANSGGERFEVTGLYRFGDFYYAGGQLLSPWTWQRDGRDIGRAMLTYRSPDFDHWSQATAFSFARPGQTISKPLVGQQTHMGAGPEPRQRARGTVRNVAGRSHRAGEGACRDSMACALTSG